MKIQARLAPTLSVELLFSYHKVGIKEGEIKGKKTGFVSNDARSKNPWQRSVSWHPRLWNYSSGSFIISSIQQIILWHLTSVLQSLTGHKKMGLIRETRANSARQIGQILIYIEK